MGTVADRVTFYTTADVVVGIIVGFTIAAMAFFYTMETGRRMLLLRQGAGPNIRRADMTTPTGGLLANVTASVAEWERRIISARTKEALAARKAAGVRLGRPRLLADDVAGRIRVEREGGSTLQAIADRLNAQEIMTPSGRIWSPALVRMVTLQTV